MGLASSRVMTMSASATGYSGAFGGGFGRGPVKGYDEKMMVQIYKSLMMAQGQLVSRDAAKLCSELACLDITL